MKEYRSLSEQVEAVMSIEDTCAQEGVAARGESGESGGDGGHPGAGTAGRRHYW